jgi:MOSC domain-containing protein YiiM
MVSVNEADVKTETGLADDYHARNGRSKRQVTIIQQEHLDVVGMLLERESVPPEITRRNLVVSGINLVALKDQRFRIGEVVFEGSGPCAPCSRMEENLGPGGFNAMRGHGGITTVVVEAGTIRVSDTVEWIGPRESSDDDADDTE